ncbi:MAG: DUF5689 domain-containing protein [Rikenellaceae bacterium]
MAQRIVYISAIALLAACADASTFTLDHVSIASLRNIEANNRSVLISQSISIEGVITANSEYGEFYKTLIIEDESAAVKILCDIDDDYQLYPYGYRVSVSCSGLYLNNLYGALTLGAEPTGDYTLDYIEQSKLGRYLKEGSEQTGLPRPTTLTIDQLTPLHTYQLVEIEEVTITNSDGVETFCQRDPLTNRTVDTYHIITDKAGNSAELSVDRLCAYADLLLPSGPCTIHAVVSYYFDGEYSLTITNCGWVEL